MLTIDTLSFSFSTRRVLADITLHCNAGQTIGIVGRSGIGKTTLLNCICGYLNDYSGSVTVAGLPPREAARAQKIGFVFQSPTLVPWLTVRENVCLPLLLQNGRADNASHIDEAMRNARIIAAQHLRPHQLSGGMQTRAAIARSIVYRPSLLLLDEPFTGLDDVVKEELFTDLQTRWLASATASVLVSHDLSEVTRLCDRVYVLKADDDGTCRIVHCEEVPLGKPRNVETFDNPAFLASRKQIWTHLQ